MPNLKLDDQDLSAAIIALQNGAGKITAQGVAVIDATDAASALTQINALLASLRTAGVIAT